MNNTNSYRVIVFGLFFALVISAFPNESQAVESEKITKVLRYYVSADHEENVTKTQTKCVDDGFLIVGYQLETTSHQGNESQLVAGEVNYDRPNCLILTLRAHHNRGRGRLGIAATVNAIKAEVVTTASN